VDKDIQPSSEFRSIAQRLEKLFIISVTHTLEHFGRESLGHWVRVVNLYFDERGRE
jgi:hypothetical protein